MREHPASELTVEIDVSRVHVELSFGEGRQPLEMRTNAALLAKPLGWHSENIDDIVQEMDGPAALRIAHTTASLVRIHLGHAQARRPAAADVGDLLRDATDRADAVAYAQDHWGLDPGAEYFVDMPTPWTDIGFQSEAGPWLACDPSRAATVPTVLRITHSIDYVRVTDPSDQDLMTPGVMRATTILPKMHIGFVPDALDRLRVETRNPHLIALRAAAARLLPVDAGLLLRRPCPARRREHIMNPCSKAWTQLTKTGLHTKPDAVLPRLGRLS